MLSLLLPGPFSSWRKRGLLFIAVASLLCSCGSVAVAFRLSCSVACGIFLNQGSNLCLLYRQVDSLPLSPREIPEKNLCHLKVKSWEKWDACMYDCEKEHASAPAVGSGWLSCSWGSLMCWESFFSHCNGFTNSVNIFLHVSMRIFTDATVWTSGVQRETCDLFLSQMRT